MRVLNRLDISGSFGLGSTTQDEFVIGSPNLENNDISTDTLNVWANANFKNNVILGSNSSDLIYVSGTLKNEGGAELTGSFSGSGQNLNNIPNSALQFYEIRINGGNYALGSTASVGTISAIQAGNNINVSVDSTIQRTVSLANDISLNSITSSDIFVSNNLKVNGTASIGFLETINQTSLNIGDKYIIILSGATDHTSLDGSGLLWGSGAVGDPTQGPLGEMAYVRYYAANDQIEIFPGLKVSGSLTASAASSFTEITASIGFSGGSFAGTNVSASNGLTGSNLHIVSQAEFDGGVKLPIVTKTSNYTLTSSKDYIVAFSGSNLTGTLPDASGIGGSTFVIKNLHTSSVYLTSSTARFDGDTSLTIYSRYSSYTLISDNTNWLIV